MPGLFPCYDAGMYDTLIYHCWCGGHLHTHTILIRRTRPTVYVAPR